ncbi:hypothetical protein BDW66DRAFT_147425 [Aspergillus desertorum]
MASTFDMVSTSLMTEVRMLDLRFLLAGSNFLAPVIAGFSTMARGGNGFFYHGCAIFGGGGAFITLLFFVEEANYHCAATTSAPPPMSNNNTSNVPSLTGPPTTSDVGNNGQIQRYGINTARGEMETLSKNFLQGIKLFRRQGSQSEVPAGWCSDPLSTSFLPIVVFFRFHVRVYTLFMQRAEWHRIASLIMSNAP